MKNLLLILSLIFVLTACGSTQTQVQPKELSLIEQEAPLAIVIMPPINNSNNVDAKEYLYSSLAIPLINKGYYVFSPYLTLDLFQQESAYDAELFIDSDLSQFQKVLGADAVLFTVINHWQKGLNTIQTNVEYILRSTHSNKELFRRQGDISLDTSTSNSASLAGLVVNLISTAATPIITAARMSNVEGLKNLPIGKYRGGFPKGKLVTEQEEEQEEGLED